MVKCILLSIACDIIAILLAVIVYLMLKDYNDLTLLLTGVFSGSLGSTIYFFLVDYYDRKSNNTEKI